MRKIIFGCFVIITLFGTVNTYAQCACANAGESEADEIKRSDAAFVGKAIEVKKIKNIENTEYQEYDITFKIEKSLKDDSNKTITVKNITSGDSDFEEKESYLVFAIINNDKLLAWIGCCTRTRKINATTNPNLKCLDTNSQKFYALLKHLEPPKRL